MKKRPIDPDAPLEPLAAAVLLQACIDANSPVSDVAKDAQSFLEHDGALWFEAAGIPYVDARAGALKKVIRGGRAHKLLRKFADKYR